MLPDTVMRAGQGGSTDVRGRPCYRPHLLSLFSSCGPFLKSLLNLLQYCFCFMFCFLALRHVRSYLQGSNLHLLHWKAKPQPPARQASPFLCFLKTDHPDPSAQEDTGL